MIIKEGTHYARPLQLIKKLLGIRYTAKRAMSAVVRFHSDCHYEIGKDQSDINKLFGFSLGHHHDNSFRVGWRWTWNNKIELVSYIYMNGIRLRERHICYCDFCEYYNIGLEIDVEDGTYKVTYTIDGREAFVPIYHSAKVKRYISYPLSLYFGGNCTAPHDMIIDMNVKF